VKRIFIVLRSRGPAWDPARTLVEQKEWQAHATFMDALFDEGFVLLAGPPEGSPDALIVMRAASAEQIASRLAADPWTASDLLRTTRIDPWTLRLGSLP